MNTTEKKYLMELTEVEVINLAEALNNTVEETVFTGNDIDTFMEMVKSYLKEHPSQVEAACNITRNYSTLNSVLLQHRNTLHAVIGKAEAMLKAIEAE